MRVDVYVKEVLARCEALKRSGMWLSEPRIRPRAWIENFDECDKYLAAKLLERFVFYSQLLTDALLTASFYSIGDGLKKGPVEHSRDEFLALLPNAIFTPVLGENPNPTDSGYYLCRRTRQVLAVDEDKQIKSTREALEAAKLGKTIIFVDDFIGSGDQFLKTWRDGSSGTSFEIIQQQVGFPSIYVSLVGTESGIYNIWQGAPNVSVCVTHKIDERETIWGIRKSDQDLFDQIDYLLKKYAPRLTPNVNDQYMKQGEFIIYGYKNRGLFFAFEHSVPDATLPIFWCRGTNNWEPLIERT